MSGYEEVVYDPDDLDTYPSVCADRGEVEARFGFTGGERLAFDRHGAFVGPLDENDEPTYDWRRMT